MRSIVSFLILWFGVVGLVHSQEKMYIILLEDDPILGVEDLPALGLDIHFLFIDAYETVLDEVRQEIVQFEQFDEQTIRDNAEAIELMIREITQKYEPDMLAAFQDKIRAVEISNKYNINTLPAILMTSGPNKYKLLLDELNIAVAYEIFQGQPYEEL